MKKLEGEALKVILKYCKLTNAKGFHPNTSDMLKVGVDRNKIRYYFGSMTKLKAYALEYDPKAFKDIVDDKLFTPKTFKALLTKAEKHNVYVLSTAVEGCQVHEGFMNSIENYEKRRKAMLITLPCSDPAANVPFHLDKKLSGKHVLVDDMALNENLFLSSISLSAKHIDPITGLGRIGQRNGSFIYASPKQRLKMVPTSSEELPHAIMTTGALTKPEYSTSRYLSKRTAYIADNDHVLGAVIAEIVDDTMFHFRQVQADNKGRFVDLGIQYSPDGSIGVLRPEALVLGDWHSGETDSAAKKVFITDKNSVLNTTMPKRVVIHDGFNGRSISHHEAKNRILRAQRALKNQLSLEDELVKYASDLEYLCSFSFIEEVVISLSNHDEFLHRYLSDGRYLEDAHNHRLALALAADMTDGKNPIQAFMERKGIKNGNKLVWLRRDEDYKIAGIELGAHGDKGANGAKGSLHAMENAYGNSVSGHAHTPEILRGAWQVGTLSLLNLEYNKGPSGWMHTSCLVYPNGSRQLINCIDKQWRLDG